MPVTLNANTGGPRSSDTPGRAAEGSGTAVPATIIGSFRVRGVLTAVPATGYSNLTYQWKSNGTNISGQTASTYTVTTATVGTNITCAITGTYTPTGSNALANVPGIPTLGTAVGGNNQVSQPYTLNADNGGATVTNNRLIVYKSSDNSVVGEANSTSSPAVLTGITNGVAVYCTLLSQNSEGWSDPSAQSNVVTPANTYARWQAALAAVAAGTGYAKLVDTGDSTTAGAYSLGNATPVAGNRAVSPPVLLKNKLAALQSSPVIANGWFGDQSFTITNSSSPFAYDARLSQPDGAAWIGTSTRVAGGSIMLNNTNANRFGFLPTDGSVDTFEVTYAVNTGLGAFTITRGAQAAQAVSQSGTAGIGKATYTTALGNTDPLYLARTSGGAYIASVDSWNSAVKSIRVCNVGWSGGRCSDWIDSSTAFAPFLTLKALNGDLYIIQPFINEMNTGVAVATAQANLATLVDGLLAQGSCVALITPYPINTTVMSQANQQLYVDAVKAVATARGLKVCDVNAAFVSWANANSLGYMANDLHPQQAGYQAAADLIAPFVLSL